MSGKPQDSLFKMAVIMALFAVSSSLLLSYTYSKTAPRIQGNMQDSKKAVMKELLPEAVSFSEVVSSSVKVRCFRGLSSSGGETGYIIEGSAKGYGGDIAYLLSLTTDLKVGRLKVLSHSETPGLGAKVSEEGFLSQFCGLAAEKLQLKKNSASGAIDAVTAATISSRALTDSVRRVVEDVFSVLKPAAAAGTVPAQVPSEASVRALQPEKKRYILTDGVFGGKAAGFAGPVEVSVTVHGGRITEIESVSSGETKEYAAVFAEIKKRILMNQGTRSVDGVSGATYTSAGLITAVKAALKGSWKQAD